MYTYISLLCTRDKQRKAVQKEGGKKRKRSSGKKNTDPRVRARRAMRMSVRARSKPYGLRAGIKTEIDAITSSPREKGIFITRGHLNTAAPRGEQKRTEVDGRGTKILRRNDGKGVEETERTAHGEERWKKV